MSRYYEHRPLSADPNPKILTSRSVRRRSGIGSEYWDFRIADINNASYRDTILKYVKSLHTHPRGTGLFFWGPVGTGKTSMASCVLKHVLARGGRVLSVRCSVAIDRLCSKNPGLAPDDVPFQDALLGIQYLLLDDFRMPAESWKKQSIENVIASRCDDRLPTLITANIDSRSDFESMRETLPWLWSRLTQRFVVVNVNGIDQRPANRGN